MMHFIALQLLTIIRRNKFCNSLIKKRLPVLRCAEIIFLNLYFVQICAGRELRYDGSALNFYMMNQCSNDRNPNLSLIKLDFLATPPCKNISLVSKREITINKPRYAKNKCKIMKHNNNIQRNCMNATQKTRDTQYIFLNTTKKNVAIIS